MTWWAALLLIAGTAIGWYLSTTVIPRLVYGQSWAPYWRPAKLTQLKKQFAGIEYRLLIREHVQRQSPEKLAMGIEGTLVECCEIDFLAFLGLRIFLAGLAVAVIAPFYVRGVVRTGRTYVEFSGVPRTRLVKTKSQLEIESGR